MQQQITADGHQMIYSDNKERWVTFRLRGYSVIQCAENSANGSSYDFWGEFLENNDVLSL